jgi:transcriptional regulator with XRE-family HTH domain
MREGHRVSQQEFAEELGILRTSLSQIENGKRDIKTGELIKMAHFFNISVDRLLDLKKEPEVIIDNGESKEVEKQEFRINVPQKNIQKFKDVFLYILNKVGSKPNIGETVFYRTALYSQRPD